MKKHSAPLFMASIAILLTVAHFIFGWYAFVGEAETHGQSANIADYSIEWARDTFENLQSEFWQLAVQFLVLAGAFRAWHIHAYEEDMEELKQLIKERSWNEISED